MRLDDFGTAVAQVLPQEQPIQQNKGSVLRLLELESVCERDDEQRNEEDAPEGGDNADKPAQIGHREVVAVANRRHGDDDVPHRRRDVREVDVYFTLEDLEANRQLQKGEEEGIKYDQNRIILHE